MYSLWLIQSSYLQFQMFKKNPNRPPVALNLKRTQGGYKVIPNECLSVFQVKRIIRTMYRPDLVPQGTSLGIEQNGLSMPTTIIQPPSHLTFPAFAGWFSLEEIHPIEKEAFPEFFEAQKQSLPFSFGTRNARLYKYYRNTMVGMWLQNVKKHLSAAHCRRNLVGDVSVIVRIHGFLQNWGIINFPSREHSKGIQIGQADRLTCYVCEQNQGDYYYVAQLDEVILQLCQGCFKEELYPSEMTESDFVRVLQRNYEQTKHRIMSWGQLLRLLEVLAANRDKEKEMWTIAQKQFAQFTREQLVYNFLRAPKTIEMNTNIFQNNEDVSSQSQPEEDPTIFEDYQNPLQSAIAIAYYKYKTEPEASNQIGPILAAAQRHSNYLQTVQEEKIEELTKMLVDVSFSKLELKSIFIQEYENLVEKCLISQKSTVSNTLAECLKANLRFVQSNTEAQVMEVNQ